MNRSHLPIAIVLVLGFVKPVGSQTVLARGQAQQWLLEQAGKSGLVIKHRGRIFRQLKIVDTVVAIVPNPRYAIAAVLAAKTGKEGVDADFIYFVDLRTGKKQRLRLGRGSIAWLVSQDSSLWSPAGECMQIGRLASSKKNVWRPDGVVLVRVDEVRNWLKGAPWQSNTLVNKNRSSEFLGWAAECSPAIRSGDPSGFSVYWWFDAKTGNRQILGRCPLGQETCIPRQTLMKMVSGRK